MVRKYESLIATGFIDLFSRRNFTAILVGLCVTTSTLDWLEIRLFSSVCSLGLISYSVSLSLLALLQYYLNAQAPSYRINHKLIHTRLEK
jgi:hypothetical protein